MSVSNFLLTAFGFGYGTLALSAMLVASSVTKPNFRKLSEEDKKELEKARERLWDLSLRPFGTNHRFCVLRNGRKLHYVESVQRDTTSESNLIIFLHGYPDSYALWKHYLQNPRLAVKATMIAVDLPGFGGSDSFEKYRPADVLEAITEFILKMREQHLTVGSGKVVVVSHDWGGIIGFRLAAEAPQLADRFVMANVIHPPLAVANVKSRLSTTKQMFKTWLRSPLNFRLLRRAFSNIAPLFRQMYKSGYVFIFNLPYPMANIVGSVGDFWWFRFLNAITEHPDPVNPLTGSHGMDILATTIGPSQRECTTAVNGTDLAYSESVRQRADTGGNQEKLTYYRHGLAFSRWRKSIEILWELDQLQQQQAGRRRSSSSAGLFDTGPEGSLKVPTTVIWGKGDIAMENAIALEGFRDYFASPSSQLIQISRCGHWSPVEKHAVPVFDQVLEWAVTGEHGSLKDRLGDNYPLAQILVER